MCTYVFGAFWFISFKVCAICSFYCCCLDGGDEDSCLRDYGIRFLVIACFKKLKYRLMSCFLNEFVAIINFGFYWNLILVRLGL